jgi:predicted  nucleic acid-binding Zn-ribbon protein
VNLRCVNCGGENIEVGEGGTRSKCAQCGCATFTRKMGNGTVTETHTPGRTMIKVEAFRGVPHERFRQMCDEIHALIDSTPNIFER